MTFKELEQKINEIAIDRGLNTIEQQNYYDRVADNIEYIVRDIIKDVLKEKYNYSIYVTTYKGNVVLKYYDYNEIKIKVKRFKGEEKFNYGFVQYYYLNKVEIDLDNKDKTIEDWYDEGCKYQKEKQQKQDDNISEFISFLKNKNMTLEEFEHYNSLYNKFRYKISKQLNS